MQWGKAVAVMSGIVLLLSTAALTDTFADDLRNPIYVSQKVPVELSFDMNGCKNSLTCGAEYLVGEAVSFSGTLTGADGRPIPNAEIKILKLLAKPELVTIVSGVTGIDGGYDLKWTAEFTPVEKPHTSTLQKFLKETVVFLAQYEGDDTYADAMTSKQTATIHANQIFTTINAEQRVYGPGDSALIFIAFIDSNDEFVDPDSIRVVYDQQEMKIEKKKTGSYTVMTPSLTVDHHQVYVIPEKAGYNIETGFLTVQVSGFFGKS
ncbi:MAG: hypothetical protein ACE5KA_04075 [Nitrososphaerales archaeon]